ncbi:MAG TPA: rod shape-determining protein RodA [Clostridiales bacterium UBA8153]|nr:rod shape-determining protein RodA [Clostridiales bacterium UBA8153]
MFGRRLLRNLDFRLLGLALALAVVGIIVLTSATEGLPAGRLYHLRRQLLAFALGIVAMVVMLAIDYRDFDRMAKPIYWAQLCLLLAVLVVGRTAQGATRWLELGRIPLPQPSEIARLAVIIGLASHLSRRDEPVRGWLDMARGFGLVLPPALLILIQPNLGTALIFFVFGAGMLYVAGVPGRRLLALALAGLVLLTAGLYLHLHHGSWVPLYPHQVNRLTSFVRPDVDPLNTGYQLIQSKIAVGSGRFWGRGLLDGTQNTLRFIPEKHTDFIFSVIGEELGFAGSALVVLAFVLLPWGGLSIARRARDRFGSLLVVGIVIMWAGQAFVNLGMTLGIMPITGLPLPFISYGSSALIVNFAALGLVLNVGMRRKSILF